MSDTLRGCESPDDLLMPRVRRTPETVTRRGPDTITTWAWTSDGQATRNARALIAFMTQRESTP